MDTKPVIYILGILIIALSGSMLLPLFIDLFEGNPDWKVFGLCMLVTSFFGGVMVLSTAGHPIQLSSKQGFLMITLSWFLLCFFSALPFWFYADQRVTFTDAFFEATSGLTTTGATVFTNLESMPKGLLIWRALLQWLGGIGIIIMALSVLPFLKVGGMQLFQTEMSESEKALPRSTHFASAIGIIYMALTFICMLCYMTTGMDAFNSLAHAMTTIATGGYSTFDSSFADFETNAPLIVATIFMICGGIPFILYLKALNGNVVSLFRDPQVKLFLSIIGGLTLFFYIYMHWIHQDSVPYDDTKSQIVHSAFNITSILTGTGYASEDYEAWGPIASMVFFIIMTMGACAGSTSCGIKLFRFQVLYSIFIAQIKKLLHPHGVFLPHYAGKTLSETIQTSVTSFFFVFAASFALVAMALACTGLDFITSVSGSATAIANVGPGLGDIIGPTGNFSTLSDTAKWILSIAMLLGRLEIFTVLVLFAPNFWRR